MALLYTFDTPREVYRAGAFVISCFDARFELVVRKFIARRDGTPADHVRVAGGPKALSSPARPEDREFLLEQLRASIRLHDTGRVILIGHSDCGACGGLEAFGGDTARERAWHSAELTRAARVIRDAFPALDMEIYFANFDGVWDVAGEEYVCAN